MTSDQGPQGFVLPVRVQRCWSVGTFTTADALRRHFTERPFFVPNRAGAGFGLVSPSCQLPWAKLAPSVSTAPAEEGSQTGSIVGLWLVTFECDGAVWDVGFDQWHSDGTDFEPLKAGWRRYSLPVGTFRRGTPPPNQSFTAVGPGR